MEREREREEEEEEAKLANIIGFCFFQGLAKERLDSTNMDCGIVYVHSIPK